MDLDKALYWQEQRKLESCYKDYVAAVGINIS